MDVDLAFSSIDRMIVDGIEASKISTDFNSDHGGMQSVHRNPQ